MKNPSKPPGVDFALDSERSWPILPPATDFRPRFEPEIGAIGTRDLKRWRKNLSDRSKPRQEPFGQSNPRGDIKPRRGSPGTSCEKKSSQDHSKS
jgi:hypothetical protein